MQSSKQNEASNQQIVAEQFKKLEELLQDLRVKVLGETIATEHFLIWYEPESTKKTNPAVIARSTISIGRKGDLSSLGFFAKETYKDGTTEYVVGNAQVIGNMTDSHEVVIEALPELIESLIQEINALIPQIEITPAIRARLQYLIENNLPLANGTYINEQA